MPKLIKRSLISKYHCPDYADGPHLIQGQDRLGVLYEYHFKLANAGVNVYASNGTTDGRGGFGYVLWVKPEDYTKAARALGV